MELDCPSCGRVLLFSGDPPSYCGYCREPLPLPPGSSLARRNGSALQPPSVHPYTSANGHDDSIGEYRLGVRLGAGGMGTVCEAVHATTGRRVAIKLLSQRLSGDPQQLERFRQEGRLASQINHPRCVFVYAADEDRGRPYIVMELMAGTTLEDQIKGQGRPLPIREAIDRTLEIIDGLTAAHRLGVLHRDVKPSNCFLLADGTVKVGDFGLSKVLSFDAEFSEPGVYKGTVTFSPLEQLRNEPLDFRADVYSVTATLFFLLTGRAPFEGESWVTSVAKAASEPAPDLRRLRPDAPGSLARLVRRGLHADRGRRFQSLDELRLALTREVPARLTSATLGLRVGAWLIDEAVLGFRFLVPWDEVLGVGTLANIGGFIAWTAISVTYFALSEGYGGASLGKRILRLRVFRGDGLELAGVKRAAWRALLMAMAFAVPRLAITPLPATAPRDLIQAFGTMVGLLALAWPMRPTSGFRGLHEWASGTRVVQLPWPEPPLTFPSLRPVRESLARPENVPDHVGPYRIRGLVSRHEGRVFLDATEDALGRHVLISLDANEAPLTAARRELARPARLRWLTAGEGLGGKWDAFLAPAGSPIEHLVSPREPLPWAKVRPVLEQLAGELLDAQRDGSLPPELTLDQVRVQEDGRVQLIDWPLSASPRIATPLQLVQRVAALLLEGRVPRDGELPRALRAPVPGHAVPILDRLTGVRDPGPSLEAFVADLDATRNAPRAVGTAQKIGYLAVLVVLHSVGLLLMFAPTFLLQSVARQDQSKITNLVGRFWDLQTAGPQSRLWAIGTFLSMPVIFWPAVWVMWAYVFRGGFGYGLTGLRLVRQDGRAPTRLQCAFRILLVWMPLTLLLLVANFLRSQIEVYHDMADTVTWSAVGLLGVFAYFSVLFPSRSPHDWLAGTWQVPE